MEDPQKIAAIIQARMGSSRLPGKTLMTVDGRPLLDLLIGRLRQARGVDVVAVATTASEKDAPIVERCRVLDAPCFRGSEDDVLDRCYQAAAALGCDPVMRFTGDCPLLSPELCDDLIAFYRDGGYDYVHTGDTVPEGLGAEIFSFAALERAWREATLKTDREHMTMYIFRNENLFRKAAFNLPEDDSLFRVTVDDARDFQVVEAIARHFGDRILSVDWPEIKAFLRERPEVFKLNAGAVRFEGYIKAWAAENPNTVNPRTNAR